MMRKEAPPAARSLASVSPTDSDDDGVPCLFALDSLNETVRRDHYSLFVIFISGNFRLTAAATAACSGFPELLAKASRA